MFNVMKNELMAELILQYCGSVTYWYGSGSADPYLWLTDLGLGSGSGSCYFRQWPSRWQLKILCFLRSFAFYFSKLHLDHFSTMKSHFCLMIEGSRGGSVPCSCSNGSGPRMLKNILSAPEKGFLVSCHTLFCRNFVDLLILSRHNSVFRVLGHLYV